MPKQPKQQPFHEPTGFSPEDVRRTPVWLVSLVVAALVLAAGVIAWLRLSGRI